MKDNKIYTKHLQLNVCRHGTEIRGKIHKNFKVLN